MDTRDLYLDLLKRNLTNLIFLEKGLSDDLQDPKMRGPALRKAWSQMKVFLKSFRGQRDLETQIRERTEGLSWPQSAETMVGLKRLDNVQELIETVVREGIPGDLMETGVWRGGCTIFMRAVLKTLGVTDRCVWVADSFEGLPPPDEKYPADQGDKHHTLGFLACSLENVKANFERYHMLDEQVKFLKGFFEQSLPDCPVESLALMRLDGDMYSSTIVALESLYKKLSPGGFVIIDDYHAVEGCQRAVDDFRAKEGIGEGAGEALRDIDEIACYWRKA